MSIRMLAAVGVLAAISGLVRPSIAQPPNPTGQEPVIVRNAVPSQPFVRLDALDPAGQVLLVVAAPIVEPDVLLVHAEALRRAASVRIDDGSCQPAGIVGVIGLDPDHRLALVRLDRPVGAGRTVEIAPIPAVAGQPATIRAMLLPMECGYLATTLEPTPILATHLLPTHALVSHIVVRGGRAIVAGSPAVDERGRLIGMVEDGRDSTSSVVVGAQRLLEVERFDPIPLAEFRQSRPPDPVLATQLAQQGAGARGQGELREARRLVAEALALDPDCWLAHYERGVERDLSSRPDAAVEALTRSIELQPAFCESHYSLGLVHLKQGRNAEAIPPLRDAVRLNPGHAVAWGMLCVALESAGRPEESFEAGEAAVALGPADESLYRNLAILYQRHGREDDAIAVWRRALDERPTELAARRELGGLLADLDRHAEAADVLAPLLDEPRADPLDLARLAISRALGGDLAAAQEAVDAALRRFPDDQVLQQIRDRVREAREDEARTPRAKRGKPSAPRPPRAAIAPAAHQPRAAGTAPTPCAPPA